MKISIRKFIVFGSMFAFGVLKSLAVDATYNNLEVNGQADFTGANTTFGTSGTVNPGVTLSYVDGTSGVVSVITSKSSAIWQWGVASGTSSLVSMKLDAGNQLILYTAGTGGTAAIALNPAGTSSISGNITISGTNNVLPNQTLTSGSSIVTRSLGDARYVMLSGSNGDAYSITFGIGAITGSSAVAIGAGATSENSGVAIGPGAQAAYASTAVGGDAESGTYSIAIGGGAFAADYSTALGATASSNYSVALGWGADVRADNGPTDSVGSSAIGYGAWVWGEGCTAVGGASVWGYYSIAVGNGAYATDGSTIAVGSGASAANYGSIAIGANSNGTEEASVALGEGAHATGSQSTALGTATYAVADNSTAIGPGAYTSGNNAVAIGGYALAYEPGSFGLGGVAGGTNSVAIGYNASAHDYSETVIGQYNVVSSGSTDGWVSSDNLLVVGNGTDGSHLSNALSIKKNGDTTVSGALTISGTTTSLNKISSGGLVVIGGTDSHGTYVVSGTNQLVLIPQQGDLSMGAYTSGPAPH